MKKNYFLVVLCAALCVSVPLGARDLPEILTSGYIMVGVRLSPAIYNSLLNQH